jgi:aminocarboxymuconate-semialdehyde decarboxylase
MNPKSAIAASKSIDVHAHAVLADSLGKAGRHGPEIGYSAEGSPWFRVGDYRLDGVRYEGSPFMEPDLRIKAMDAAGIDFQVLSPNPLTYFHFIDADNAIRFCAEHNNALAKVIDQYPNRLGGFCALPMQDISAACDELERAVTELNLLGAYIGTDFGMPLNDLKLTPLYEKFIELDVPLFIHPAPAGIDGPLGDQNLKQFDLDLLTGFAAQESIATATLIYGGVLHRHPELDICISHAGGAVLALIGRLNMACIKRPWVPDYLRFEGAFEEMLGKLWFDTHVHDSRILKLVIDVVGDERLVMGTNFAGWDQHHVDMTSPEMAVFTANAKRLLRAS